MTVRVCRAGKYRLPPNPKIWYLRNRFFAGCGRQKERRQQENVFGYIICNREGLSKEELTRYRRIYCGLCRCLGERFGQFQRMNLNYDMTFLILFLSSLYEPPEQEQSFRCAAHPLHKRSAVQNKFTQYAADMSILLSYYKCMDDWQDEHSRFKYYYAGRLKEDFQNVQRRYPRQSGIVKSALEELSRIEKSHESMPDEAINCSGKMLSELFVYAEDFWSNSLRAFGYELGRFIYLMDATLDYAKDRKKENYNPLFGMQKEPAQMEEILTTAIGNATRLFEQLPLVQDEHLLKNILYGGVWQQYYAKVPGKEKSHG